MTTTYEVEKGSKFTVTTDGGTVEVLGTSFNVRERDKNLEVKCYTGKVGVTHPKQSQQTVLTPNKGVKLTANSVTSFDFETVQQPSWATGESSFTEEGLTTIFDELEITGAKPVNSS